MPAPPILDISVVWHPSDDAGQQVFDRLQRHFHSVGYSGLAGGAVAVYARSVGWLSESGSPRPLLLSEGDDPTLKPAQFHAIVPVIGMGLRDAVQASDDWAQYLRAIAASPSDTVVVLPVSVPGVNLSDSTLVGILGAIQRIPDAASSADGLLERTVAQQIAQMASGKAQRVRVFISHAKHFSETETDLPGGALFEQVRSVIARTHLGEFFDARDLQPGTDWAAELNEHAGKSALLMVRTDRYSSREWTQQEVLVAKRRDVPVVGLIALTEGEARGSFLMDHVPTVPLSPDEIDASIEASLDRLVDEVLKRALWVAQSTYIRDQDGFDWTPVHAPEPVTAVEWLAEHRAEQPGDRHLWIIHPDPPLGFAERAVIDQLATLAGFEARVDILTPRTFAARGGVLK
jgi:hypothetical protein